jgi:DNA-binding SARP family transcriptional activator
MLDDGVEVDLHDMERLTGALNRGSDPTVLARLPELIAATDVLPGWGDDWIILERERFRELRLHALERAGDALLGRGDHTMAVQAAMAAIEVEPYRESAQLLLLRVHLSEGNRAAAIRTYEAYRALMGNELGIEPSESMRRLMSGGVAVHN